jgi:hypothetical protein
MEFSGCDAQFYGKTARRDGDKLAELAKPASPAAASDVRLHHKLAIDRIEHAIADTGLIKSQFQRSGRGTVKDRPGVDRARKHKKLIRSRSWKSIRSSENAGTTMALSIVRLGDPTSHGGKVISASTTHLIGGIGIARVGDKVICPISGHGVNAIVEWCGSLSHWRAPGCFAWSPQRVRVHANLQFRPPRITRLWLSVGPKRT